MLLIHILPRSSTVVLGILYYIAWFVKINIDSRLDKQVTSRFAVSTRSFVLVFFCMDDSPVVTPGPRRSQRERKTVTPFTSGNISKTQLSNDLPFVQVDRPLSNVNGNGPKQMLDTMCRIQKDQMSSKLNRNLLLKTIPQGPRGSSRNGTAPTVLLRKRKEHLPLNGSELQKRNQKVNHPVIRL